MTDDDIEPRREKAVSTTWWTPRRTKLAALSSFGGGVGGLLGSFGGVGLVGFSLGDTGAGITPGIVVVLYPVLHVLMAVGVLAANVRYGSSYGRRGRIVATLLVLSLVGEAGSILVLVVGRTELGALLLPIGVFHGAMYMVLRLFGSLYGIGLWRYTTVNRLTAALFIALFPAIFGLGPLTRIGFPGPLIGAPLDLAFIALGYELWTDAADAPPSETEATG